MTKKFVKAALIASCALVLMFATIAGTIAYLTSTVTIQNTFTSGKISIKMDETAVDIYGVATGAADRVTNNKYKLLPGKTYIKDPIIHVEAGSEKCYLYVKIENGLDGLISVTDQLNANKWHNLSGDIWHYESTVDASKETKDIDINVFEGFAIDSAEENLSAYERKTITVTAYAVQADGFGTAADAWAATFGAQANQ